MSRKRGTEVSYVAAIELAGSVGGTWVGVFVFHLPGLWAASIGSLVSLSGTVLWMTLRGRSATSGGSATRRDLVPPLLFAIVLLKIFGKTCIATIDELSSLAR